MAIYFVDIDETICKTIDPLDYSQSKPDKEAIEKINELYYDGNTIVYWTARGSKTGINWYHLTKQQLDAWGARHTELRMGKPYYDFIIDDKSKRIEEV